MVRVPDLEDRMTDQPTPSTAVEAFQPPKADVIGQDELDRLWRVSDGLAKSGLYSDARQGVQAFAKVLYGRDLGMSPTEAMSAIHIIEGKPTLSAEYHATRVRLHPHYDYKITRLDRTGCEILFTRTTDGDTFLSTFDEEDAKAAGLFQRKGKNNSPGMYAKFARNMYFSRAMSNGVAWFCPEVMGGLRVYTPGEIEEREVLTAGEGEPSPQGVELPPEVEAVLARAEGMGHPLADRATAEMVVGGRSPERVQQWVVEATATLNAAEETVTDAEVVADLRDFSAEASAKMDEATIARDEGDNDRADALEAEAEALADQASVQVNPGQMDLGGSVS
jgi:hypothetical protein